MGSVCACEDPKGASQIDAGQISSEDPDNHAAQLSELSAEPQLFSLEQLATSTSCEPGKEEDKREDLHAPGNAEPQSLESVPQRCDIQSSTGDAGATAVNREAGSHTESSLLYGEAVEAASRCQLLVAYEKLEAAKRLGHLTSTTPECPILGRLDLWVPLIRRLLLECALPPSKEGWSTDTVRNSSANPLEEITVFWRWKGPVIEVISQWTCKGSMQQQMASTRESHLLEHLWGGQSSGMSNQHAEGSTLYRCVEKSPVIPGKSAEIIVERVFCDCSDHAIPCWVLAEKSPDISNFQKFSGRWRAFDIPPAPKGATRGDGTESGRVIEPIDTTRCRVTSYAKTPIPWIARILLTDFVISKGLKIGASMMDASWGKILSGWSASGIDKKIEDDAYFYNIVVKSAGKILSGNKSST